MELDYYKILKVSRNINDEDLKRTYKKLAMKWHPDKNLSNKIDAEARFKQIAEAYEKRAVYDQYGEVGLKGVAPTPGSGKASDFSTGFGPATFQFNPRNAVDIFAELFGYSSAFDGGMRGTRFSSSIFGGDIFGSFGGGSGCGGGGLRGTGFSSSHFGESMQQGGGLRKAAPMENSLHCSLEELYKGTTKNIKITREIVHISGEIMQVEEILTINVMPGWKKGTKITFAGKGNEQPNVVPADLVFIIDERPHNVFARDGNDLIVAQEISIVNALNGFTIHLTTLAGRNITVPIHNVIHPCYEEVVPREGMPIQKDPTKRGNLRIKFDIKFPTRLTTEQKSGIKKLLSP